jgi:hypothetical protein
VPKWGRPSITDNLSTAGLPVMVPARKPRSNSSAPPPARVRGRAHPEGGPHPPPLRGVGIPGLGRPRRAMPSEASRARGSQDRGPPPRGSAGPGARAQLGPKEAIAVPSRSRTGRRRRSAMCEHTRPSESDVVGVCCWSVVRSRWLRWRLQDRPVRAPVRRSGGGSDSCFALTRPCRPRDLAAVPVPPRRSRRTRRTSPACTRLPRTTFRKPSSSSSARALRGRGNRRDAGRPARPVGASGERAKPGEPGSTRPRRSCGRCRCKRWPSR